MSSTDATGTKSEVKSELKPRKRRNWRRIFIIGLTCVVALAIIGRVILAVAFPYVLRKVASAYDLDASYSRMEMYLLAGDVGLFDLTIRPKTGGPALMTAEYARGDVSTLNLLRGKLIVHRAELDGMQLDVLREESGRIPALEKLLASTSASQPKTDEQLALSLDPPLRVDAVRVNRLRAHWVDRSVDPPVDTQFEMTLRLTDFGVGGRPTQLLLEGTSPPLLDTVRIEGTASLLDQKLDAKLNVLMRGIHPKPAAGYLAPIGIKPVGDSITLTADANVKLRVLQSADTTKRPTQLAGNITFEKLSAVVDATESAGVDQVAIDIDSLSPNEVRLAKVTIDGVRASAARSALGNPRFAGFELVAPAAPTTAPTSPIAAATPTTRPAPQLPAMALGELVLANVRVALRDQATAPAADLAFVVDRMSISSIDSTRPDEVATLAGKFSAPGLAKSIHLTGTARPFAATRTLDAKLTATGIKPDAIRPYLDALGLESTIEDGSATCDVRATAQFDAAGALQASAQLANVKLSDARTGELVALDTAKIDGATIDPADSGIKVETIELSGPRLVARRSNDGAVSLLGLRTKAIAAATVKPASPAAAPAVAANAPVPTAPMSLPRIELGRFAWSGVDVHVIDDAVSPPTDVHVKNAGIELADLVIDLNARDAIAQPGKFKAWLAAPGVADDLRVDGTITPGANKVSADLQVAGKGLRGAALAPYLKALGVEPILRDGSIQLHAIATLAKRNGQTLAASLAIDKLTYADGGQELIGVDRLSVDDVQLSSDGVAVAAIQIDSPRARAQRNADGSFEVAGARFTLPATQPSEPTPVVATTAPSPVVATRPPFVATLGKLRVNDAWLGWSDRAVSPAVDATGRATVALDQFVFGHDAAPATMKIVANLAETLEEFQAVGEVSPSLTSPSIKLAISGRGVREGVLRPYLPPGTSIALNDGRFRATLEAGAAPNPQGGHSAKLIVSDVDYRDGESPQPLLAMESARVLVSRADVPGKVIAIDEVSVNGFETGAHKASDGTLHALGLKLGAASEKPQADATSPPANPTTAPTTSGSTDVNALIAAGREKLPLITLDKLALHARRISFVDESRAGSAPVALAEVKVTNKSRIEVLGDDPQSRPPIELQIVGGIDPIVRTFDVATQVTPFASQPSLNVTLLAGGINGVGLIAVVPELRDHIDGSQLTDGRFTTKLEATAKVAKRGPVRLDFTKPMEVTAAAHDVAFRADPSEGAPILAGVEELRAEGVRIDPATGSVIARSIDVVRPIANVTRDDQGIHVLGLTVKLPEKSDQPAAVPAGATADASKEAPREPSTNAKPQAEIAIEKFTVSGIDVNVQDTAVSPPMIVPLNSLEMEVRGLSNLALYEPRPIRFNVTAGAGKVPLQPGKPPREMFSEVSASGNIVLYPELGGWARTSVSGFELLSIRGAAAAQKVEINNGIFDSKIDVRFVEDGAIDTRSRLAFTDLRISEAEGGPIGKTLKLNGPLDATIVLVQDADGAISMTVPLKVEKNKIGGGQIAGAAAGAVGEIIARAVASAPVKAAGAVTEVVGLNKAFGLFGKKRPVGPQDAGALDFFAGDGEATDESTTVTLKQVIDAMRKDRTLELTLKHELGGADIALASQRANPSPEAAGAVGASLRQRRDDLSRQREQLAATARATLIALGSDAPAAAARLRDIESQIAATEDALDRAYELTRPGADRQAERRTRAASLEIAEARLEAVKDLIVAAKVPDAENRVKITKPQFTPAEGDAAGRISMVLVSKKKP